MPKKKALIVYGGWDGHEPQLCAQRYHDFLKKEKFEVIMTSNQDIYKNTALMSELSLICPIITLSSISDEQEAGLLNAIRSGVGIAGHHGGMTDSYRNNPEYQFMVGGQFICHPGNMIDYTVNIVNNGDPITKGINDFSIHSEQYFMHVDPSNEVLASTIMNQRKEAPWIAGTVMPVAWKRMYGAGRVFYSALGHVNADFENDDIWNLQKSGMLWAAQ